MRKINKQSRERVIVQPQTVDEIWLVRSKAGHDQGWLYLLVGQNDGRMAVVDGRSRWRSRPKYKNPKHLVILKSVPKTIWEEIASCQDEGAANARIRQIIKDCPHQ